MIDNNYDGNEEVIVRSLKQPNCIKAEIVDGKISYTIEKELSAEIVGDTKIKVGINNIDDEWEDIINDEDAEENIDNSNIEKEINDTVGRKFL